MGLTAVHTQLPDPPYPKTTKAGSFDFSLEVDRLAESDTWVLLPPEVRPWALMTWVMSWRQVPCGSWPDNDDVIAARIGCDRRLFKASRDEIMRGWKLHSDGRLYHPVVCEKVLSFIEVRTKWNEKRKAQYQQKQQDSNNVSKDTPETPKSFPRVSQPSSSSSSSYKTPPYPPDGVDRDAWTAYVEYRQSSAKLRKGWGDRARTIAAGVLRRMTPDQQRRCVDRTILSGWTGLFPGDEAKQGQGDPVTFTRGPEV